VIQKAVGPNVTLVDSAHATAERVEEVLREQGLLRTDPGPVERQYLVTDTPERFLAVGSRFLGETLSGARQIDLRLG